MNEPVRGRARGSRRRLGFFLVGVVALSSVLATPTFAAAASFTWAGAAAPSETEWSVTSNWQSGTPNGAVETLSFPHLSASGCNAEPPTAACYASENDVSGISANSIHVDDGSPYSITGQGIALGAGGLVAESGGGSGNLGSPSIVMPIELSAAQTWTVKGGMNGEQLNVGEVSGASHALTAALSQETFLGFQGAEVGPFTATGQGMIGILSQGGPGSLNATSGNAVKLEGEVGLFIPEEEANIGPLTVASEEASVQIGQSFQPAELKGTGAITLSANGYLHISINAEGTVAGVDYSQLSSAGTLNLSGTHLELLDGLEFENGAGSCASLHPGDEDKIVTSNSSVTGQFAGIANGTVVEVFCEEQGGESPTAEILYKSSHEVVAKILTAGGGGGGHLIETATTLTSSNLMPLVGEAVTLTATVTPQVAGEGVPTGAVEFRDGSQPIPGCAPRPLVAGATASTATCSVSYSAIGLHSILALYAGDQNFEESQSNPISVSVHEAAPAGGGEGGGGGGGTGTGTSTSSAAPPPVTNSTAGGPTGKRAAALRKCKKKKKRKARARCIKHAHKLPV